MTAPTASIVVCTRNRSSMLEVALGDMVGQRLPERPEGFEVVVVDDGSTDDTAMVVARVAAQCQVTVRRVDGDGRGLAHARNVGVSAARGHWIAFFDDDQRAEPTWLAELLDTSERAGADLVGGPIEVILPDGAEVGPVVRAIYGEHPTQRQRRRGITPRPGGGNRMVHRRVFQQIGLHDESLIFADDPDLIRRAEAAGMGFGWAPRAVVLHRITRDRLDPQTIYPYAKLTGAGKAWVDFRRLGRWRIAGTAVVVLAKAVANEGLLFMAVLRRSQVDVLDCRTRASVFSGYLAKTLRFMVSGDPTR